MAKRFNKFPSINQKTIQRARDRVSKSFRERRRVSLSAFARAGRDVSFQSCVLTLHRIDNFSSNVFAAFDSLFAIVFIVSARSDAMGVFDL